jgi:hypothetical protein
VDSRNLFREILGIPEDEPEAPAQIDPSSLLYLLENGVQGLAPRREMQPNITIREQVAPAQESGAGLGALVAQQVVEDSKSRDGVIRGTVDVEDGPGTFTKMADGTAARASKNYDDFMRGLEAEQQRTEENELRQVFTKLQNQSKQGDTDATQLLTNLLIADGKNQPRVDPVRQMKDLSTIEKNQIDIADKKKKSANEDEDYHRQALETMFAEKDPEVFTLITQLARSGAGYAVAMEAVDQLGLNKRGGRLDDEKRAQFKELIQKYREGR